MNTIWTMKICKIAIPGSEGVVKHADAGFPILAIFADRKAYEDS